jgi:hypothetical protein
MVGLCHKNCNCMKAIIAVMNAISRYLVYRRWLVMIIEGNKKRKKTVQRKAPLKTSPSHREAYLDVQLQYFKLRQQWMISMGQSRRDLSVSR